jgi:hypothetical protein
MNENILTQCGIIPVALLCLMKTAVCCPLSCSCCRCVMMEYSHALQPRATSDFVPNRVKFHSVHKIYSSSHFKNCFIWLCPMSLCFLLFLELLHFPLQIFYFLSLPLISQLSRLWLSNVTIILLVAIKSHIHMQSKFIPDLSWRP